MKVTKLALFAITFFAAAIAGCDEAKVVEDILSELPDDTGTKLADLKAESNEELAPVPIDAAKREEILDFPGEGATVEEFQKHAELVKSVAVNTNTLDITGCNPNPLVLEVGYGEVVEIKNRDRVAHILDHGGIRIIIPGGGSRGVVATDFLGSTGGDGLAGYGCDHGQSGIFYVNSKLIVKPHEKQRYITFKVMGFLFPDGNSGLEGVRVTVDGSGEIKETATDGSVTFKGDLPLTVRLEKESYVTTEVTVLEEDEEIILPSGNQNITFRVVEPLFSNEYGRGLTNFRDWPDYRNGPGIEGVTITCLEGSDEGTKITAANGSVTFFGTPPLTIRIEKAGYITTETTIGEGGEVPFPNEWPEEVEEVIRQLGLEERVASGWITLRWGDDEYLETLGEFVGGLCPCPNIIIRKYEDRDFMVWILIHELMHMWQNIYNSVRSPCGLHDGAWLESEEAKAWIAATEKDLQEFGPMPELDDREWARPPEENQAGFYSYWYWGRETSNLNEVLDRKADLEKLYQFAPNRCKYLEDRFGPPPPR